MFCDKCGKELAPGSIFCPNCGAKQLEEEPSAEMSASSSVSPVREAPSSQPSNQQSAERTTSPKHVTDESVYRKIICNNADYYLSQFQNILYGEKNKMNWASFFLSLYHAAYRGVWREWLRAVMWSLLIAIGFGLIASATIGYYPGVAIFFVVIAICGGIWWIIANILFAKNFNRVYLEHVEKKIAQQDFTPDPSGGRVVASIFAYAAGYTMVGIIIGALSVGSLMTGSDDSTYDDTDINDSSAYDGAAEDHDNTAATAPDTSGSIIGTDIYDYLGHWTVDMTNSALDASVSFDLESNNDILCFSAEAVWGQGDRVTKIGTTSLDMNEANMQAYGTYCDNLSNTGTVVLDFENGELYLTLVGNADHAWDISMQHEHCSRGQTDAPGALTDGVTQSIEQRLNDEAEFASMLQGQIIDRENWRSYEYLLLDTMADRNDYSSLSSVGTFEGTDSMTGVSVYQITQAEMEQWMQENYGADVADTQPDVAIYANGYYTAYGSQGFIGDTVSLLAAYELQSDTYYVQFSKQNEATMDDDGRGYAVVHFSDEYGVWQVWELGWDTESISEQSLAAYKN